MKVVLKLRAAQRGLRDPIHPHSTPDCTSRITVAHLSTPLPCIACWSMEREGQNGEGKWRGSRRKKHRLQSPAGLSHMSSQTVDSWPGFWPRVDPCCQSWMYICIHILSNGIKPLGHLPALGCLIATPLSLFAAGPRITCFLPHLPLFPCTLPAPTWFAHSSPKTGARLCSLMALPEFLLESVQQLPLRSSASPLSLSQLQVHSVFFPEPCYQSIWVLVLKSLLGPTPKFDLSQYALDLLQLAHFDMTHYGNPWHIETLTLPTLTKYIVKSLKAPLQFILSFKRRPSSALM